MGSGSSARYAPLADSEVLVTHSKSSKRDEELERLLSIEDVNNPVRVASRPLKPTSLPGRGEREGADENPAVAPRADLKIERQLEIIHTFSCVSM